MTSKRRPDLIRRLSSFVGATLAWKVRMESKKDLIVLSSGIISGECRIRTYDSVSWNSILLWNLLNHSSTSPMWEFYHISEGERLCILTNPNTIIPHSIVVYYTHICQIQDITVFLVNMTYIDTSATLTRKGVTWDATFLFSLLLSLGFFFGNLQRFPHWVPCQRLRTPTWERLGSLAIVTYMSLFTVRRLRGLKTATEMLLTGFPKVAPAKPLLEVTWLSSTMIPRIYS